MAFVFPTASGGNEKDPSDSFNGHIKTACVWMWIFLAAALFYGPVLFSRSVARCVVQTLGTANASAHGTMLPFPVPFKRHFDMRAGEFQTYVCHPCQAGFSI